MNYAKLMSVPMLLFLLAGGCSQFEKIDSPAVQVQAVQITQQTDEGARIEVTLALQNPNKVALPLVRTSYAVHVAGVGTFQLDDASNRTLPANGTQTLLLPAALASGGKNLAGASYSVTGAVTYEPPGQVRRIFTESGVPLPQTEFSSHGKLD